MLIDKQFLVLAGLLVLLVFALFYVFYYNTIASNKKSAQRVKNLKVDRQTKIQVKNSRVDEKQRRKMREDSMKTLESGKNKDASNPALPVRLQQANLAISVRTFYLYSLGMGLFSLFIFSVFLDVPWYVTIGGSVVLGFGFPRWIVNFIRARRFKKFTLAFPNAVDVIVRGIRSGLPLNDCLRIIANDAEEPVGGEFRKIVESTQVGLTVPEAVARLYESIPTSETNFFSIVISIQASAGGNLSEALSNLSKVLRDRRKMADKIQAVSMEAKSSAGIIGSLPFVVSGLISVASPGYLDPLFDTYTGNKILVISGVMMIVGILVMKKMINFKF